MVPEGTDTEKVTDISVTVITEGTFEVHSAQIKRCRAESGVSGRANGDNVAVAFLLVDHGRRNPRNTLNTSV